MQDKKSTIIALLFFRLILPGALLLSIALRPFGVSIFYLLLYLILPLVRTPDGRSFKGLPGKAVLLTLVVSAILLTIHAVFHIALASSPPYGSLVDNVPVHKIMAILGFVPYNDIDPVMAIHWLSPDAIMTLVSIIVYFTLKKCLAPVEQKESNQRKQYQQFPFLTKAGSHLSVLFLLFSSAMYPSVTSGIYFVTFIAVCTVWSLGKSLDKWYSGLCRFLMVVMGLHVLATMLYQNTFIMDLLPDDTLIARLVGLTRLVTITDNSFFYDVKGWSEYASPLIILVTYYLLALVSKEILKPKREFKQKGGLMRLDAKKLNGSLGRSFTFKRLQSRRSLSRDRWLHATKKVRDTICRWLPSKANESTPLLGSQSKQSFTRKPTVQVRMAMSEASRFSVPSACIIEPDQNKDGVASTAEDITEEDVNDEEIFFDEPDFLDEILVALFDLAHVLRRSSYIATSIAMMAWSIMYHSWATFVLLMWANIVWLHPNQRATMLRWSPLLVIYATILLIAQYVLGVAVTEQELPTSIDGYSLKSIGFDRPDGPPCFPIIIKGCFCVMFWLTLRQRTYDRRRRRTSSALADLAAPLHLSVRTAAPVLNEDEAMESRLLVNAGKWLRQFCTKFWIYMVAITLFVIGITGVTMTIFRIVYMFLFLAFTLMFQISVRLWRKMLYPFWITLIVYSMANLVLIYVYQFEGFPETIENNLHISKSLQNDLGLEQFQTADLFIKLLTPTLFLIITIMQLHYFHKDFMEMSKLKSRQSSMCVTDQPRPRTQSAISTIKDDVANMSLDSEAVEELKSQVYSVQASNKPSNRSSLYRKASYRDVQSTAPTITEHTSETFKSQLQGWLARGKVVWNKWADFLFLYLEMNLTKLVFLSFMFLCVFNVKAIHVPILVLICPALLATSKHQRHCILLCTVLVAMYLMAFMVFQIIDKDIEFNVTCSETLLNGTTLNVTYNNAEWVGFAKVTTKKPLTSHVSGYIGIIAITTLNAVVIYRQSRKRSFDMAGKANVKVMFPEVTRRDADKDLTTCIKYLFNYGFYKFGVEVTLIWLVGVVGSRMDAIALAYAVWLAVLATRRRETLSSLWPLFTGYVTTVVPLQYFIAVGLLPYFCVTYPWTDAPGENKYASYRHFFFLPDPHQRPHATKLIFDYFLLLFCARQRKMFIRERKYGPEYPGGYNGENIGQNWETPAWVNPVPDFMNYISSWLDIVKRAVLLSMLWICVAVMFLTGTNRVNLFSIGYLIGSFVFLWQGTDFYLRPKSSILTWWACLLKYNITVIVLKTILQIPGCLFSDYMLTNYCWIVQLLGIGCVNKFAGGSFKRFLRMDPSFFSSETCSVPYEDIGLAWDGVCFACLILQRRLFHSYYFYRIIDESKAITILASRGAELIEEMRQKQMKQQEENEKKILEKIKTKMERIKATQKKLHASSDKEHHHAEDEDASDGTSKAPLDSSERGYRTPEDDDDAQSLASPKKFRTPEHTPPESPKRRKKPPPFVMPATTTTGAPPSPSSALMPQHLDGYLEPRRISFGSAESSIMVEETVPDDSESVFSPPAVTTRRRFTMPGSIVTSPPSASHHTCGTSSRYKSRQKAIRSGDYYMFDEFDEVDVGKTETELEESDSDQDVPKQLGVGQLLSDALRTDMSRAVVKRRASAPALRVQTAATRTISAASDTFLPLRQRRQPADAKKEPPEPESEVIHMELSDAEVKQDSMVFETEPAPPEPTKYQKMKGFFMFIKAFLESLVVSLVRLLKKYSKDYRYVSRTLAAEKKLLKESEGFGMGLREGKQMIWQPYPSTLITRPVRKLSDISVPEIRILAASVEGGLDDRVASRLDTNRAIPTDIEEDDSKKHDSEDDKKSEEEVDEECDELEVEDPREFNRSQRHYSIYSARFTESNDDCTIEEHDSLFTKSRPLIVHLFLAFWYAILSHTDIVCYIMVFINQIQSATLLSLPLPLLVFLWGTLTIPRPTKTFWVTLIAYTEVIVLIKSMSQFELLPWNSKNLVHERDPFTPARIIGVERKHNYALYDLLLLLLIFFHRFMLKSLGLWKTTSPESELRHDHSYNIEPNEISIVREGDAEDFGKRMIEKHVAAARPRRMSRFNMHHEDETRRNHEQDEPGTSQQDDDFKDQDDERLIVNVETEIDKPYKHYPQAIKQAFGRYSGPLRNFFRRMLDRTARVTADVYAYMFMCDFINFLVVIFGFAAFGTHQGDGGVTAYLQENKVPIPFLAMLIVQFALIVIDRALYLRKYILGKILFQYTLIIGVHIWMFFVLPFITERKFNSLIPPPLWYMVKCVYLLLSAHQIRCGYPARILGNFLTKGYSYVNMYLFKGFMAIPFVFELRTMMDWMWTDTSMTLTDWLKMEDIFANIFLLKCARNVEDKYPQPRGEKKSPITKYLLGGIGLAVIISIIWFPLVFFAFGNRVGTANPPSDVTVKIRIGPYLPAYRRSAQSHHIQPYTYNNYNKLLDIYKHDKPVLTFLSNYQYDDVAVVDLDAYSTSVWEISPPELAAMRKEINGNATLRIHFVFVITHLTTSKDNPPTIEESKEISMPVRNLTALETFLDNTALNQSDWITMPTLFPKFIKVFNQGTATPAYQFIKPDDGDDENQDDKRKYRDVKMQLIRDKDTLYWRAEEICDNSTESEILLMAIPKNRCNGMVMFTFNDKRFPATLNFISGGGIIGLYTTFVLLASRVLRGFFSGIYSNIMFEDLPYVDRVLQLCLDIYLVREALELALEEDLFAKLVFLYRSPETMIKWTRDKDQSPDNSAAAPLPRPPVSS